MIEVIETFTTSKVSQKSVKKNENTTHSMANIFLYVIQKAEPRTDKELYGRLYKFNQEEELKKYTEPLERLCETQKPIEVLKRTSRSQNPESKISNIKQSERKDFKITDQDIQTGINENLEQNDVSKMPDIDNMINKLFKEKHKFIKNKIQNAMYEDKNVKEHIVQLKTGEDGIAFFAKYGNSTPVKFIHCVRNSNQYFNPYSLEIVHNASDLAKVDDYYTISPSGIVHIFSNSLIIKKVNFLEKPTEFISLSDWMRESTQFNILSNINFFKNYLGVKIFRSWRENGKKQQFKATRNKLLNNVFFCKPAYVNSIFEIKRVVFQIHNLEMISFAQCLQKQVEFEEFKGMQKEVRIKAAKELDVVFEEIVNVLNQTVSQIKDTQAQNSTADRQNLAQALMKQKPLNLIKREKAEQKLREVLTSEDFALIPQYVRFINFLCLENSIEFNRRNMFKMADELYRERKNGLFTTEPVMDENSVGFAHKEEDITNAIDQIFDENIKLIRDLPKILGNLSFESYIKELISGGKGFQDINPEVNQIILNSEDYLNVRNRIKEKVNKDFQECRKKIEINYSHCRRIEGERQRFRVEEWTSKGPKLEEIKSKLLLLKEFKKDISEKIKDHFFGVLHVDSKSLRQVLSNFTSECMNKIKEYIYSFTMLKVTDNQKIFSEYVSSLTMNIDTLNDFCEYSKKASEIRVKVGEIEVSKNEIDQMYKLLRQVNHVLDLNDKSKHDQIINLAREINEGLVNAEAVVINLKNEFVEKLKETQSNLEEKISEVRELLAVEELRKVDTPASEALKKLGLVKERLERLKIREAKIEEYAICLDQKRGEQNEGTKLVSVLFERRKELWENFDAFQRKYEEWFEGNFKKIDIDQLEKVVKKYEKFCLEEKNRIKEMSGEEPTKEELLISLTSKVEIMKDLMPVIQALGNKNLKEKHWIQILENIENGQSLIGKSSMKLNELVSIGIKDKLAQIDEISIRASGEAEIEQEIERIKRDWLETAFTIVNYRDFKDKFILSQVSEIFEKLDDNILKIQGMMGSKHVSEIRGVVSEWDRRLCLVQDTIEEWLRCQQQWMYLENVFCAEDIQRQLPGEYAKFSSIDKFWKELMKKANKKPNVLDNISSNEILQRFVDANKQLEIIQKLLEDYLELKRRTFPRFYFLSNEELLEIFAQTRNPEAVQPYLRKCFDNIKSIQFDQNTPESNRILAMVAAEPHSNPEVVEFTTPTIAEGAVECWLTRIESSMRTTLYDKLIELNKEVDKEEEILPNQIISKFPAQIVLAGNMIRVSNYIEKAIISGTLPQLLSLVKSKISGLVELINTGLNICQHELAKCLIVLDVHNRDIIEGLIGQTSLQISSFEWQKQLRYYMENGTYNNQIEEQTENKQKSNSEITNQQYRNNIKCVIRQTVAAIEYCYEYLGNSPRLVVTPLTDKCYITLTSAIHLNYGGAPSGPAGTGKTETTKDLAKAIAIQCLVFNCSDSLDYQTMGRFFSGLAQCGAWACFDEFNRIEVEVLSVIAQQILVIQNAIKEKKEDFDFEGKTIALNLKFGIFITMNPGYAGRSELPDNLKALFRPVAMMIPDYALIAEILLFSEGFTEANELARKIVYMYKLCSEQLSKQKHYDFGMRAVKSVLTMAGILRRQMKDLKETSVLLKAVKDSDLPKFLSDDLILFEGIINDLFQQDDNQNQNQNDLIKIIEQQLTLEKLIIYKQQVEKIKQLNEVIKIRHGVMVVGAAGTGKSISLKILSSVLKENGIQVDINKLNPKSITRSELFGFNDIYTNTFTHGIVSKLVINALEEKIENQKWFIMDGPVDADWIENLNTVLDDNKMLCLPDGKRIKLPNNFLMLFEVGNLDAASPATVSRCGMVFFDRTDLDMIVILTTWKNNYIEKLENILRTEPVLKFYVDYFKSPDFFNNFKLLFDDLFMVLRKKCEEPIPSNNISLVQQCLSMFEKELNQLIESLIKKIKLIKGGLNIEKFIKSFELKDHVFIIFGFSFTWTFGGNITESSRKIFNDQLRFTLIKKTGNLFVDCSSLYDFYYDYNKNQIGFWKDIVKEYTYNHKEPFFEILVDTIESTRVRTILQSLILNQKNVLISGPSGVGKTSNIKSLLNTLIETHLSFILNFSAQTNPRTLTRSLFEKLVNRGRDLGPSNGKQMVYFIDDINMPRLDNYGSQPVNELIRQLIDQGGFYDLKKYMFRHVKETNFIGACAPPEGGRNHLPSRLLRHFHLLSLPEFSDKSLETIFGSILRGYLNHDPEFKGIANSAHFVVIGAIRLYKNTIQNLLPTPSKCHYQFNLRDLAKVFQGITRCSQKVISNESGLFSLLAHEACRCFQDRLSMQKDRDWFNQKLETILGTVLKETNIQELCYTNIVSGEYKPVENKNDLINKIKDEINLYSVSTGKKLSLILFNDAINHICRIKRILSCPQGNVLLVGLAGCGKKALTTLAAHMNRNSLFQISLIKGYKESSWQDDLRRMIKESLKEETTEGKKGVVFLFTDTQILYDSFLEDINSLLNAGEIQNLFVAEELEEILETVRKVLRERKIIPDGKSELWKHFVQIVRDNLHIVLTFSPVGDSFRSRCRQFPSLINCCSIDWFDIWPEAALRSVADSEFEKLVTQKNQNINTSIFVTKDQIPVLSSIALKMNSDVDQAADKIFKTLKRKVYILPSHFTELLALYRKMFADMKNILPAKISKYERGLEKMSETKEEVERLKQKILEFQPQLAIAADENDILKKDLEIQNRIAAEKEEICQNEAEEIALTRNQISEMREVCQRELDEALPALLNAQNAASKIEKNDIAKIKSFNTVVDDILMVISAVNLIFGRKETWEEGKKFLGEIDFIKKLQGLDPMTVPHKVWSRLRINYLSRLEFNPDRLRDKVSEAICTLANYCINMEIYYLKKREVDPKEKKLKEAETQLVRVEEILALKMIELGDVKAKVSALRAKLSESIEREQSLQEKQEKAKLHLQRAEKLVIGLRDESVRWVTYSANLREEEKTVVGNLLVCAASISYIGPFVQTIRAELIKGWIELIQQSGILVKQNFTLQSVLGNPISIRDWQIFGLPADNQSIENAVIVTNSRKWALMIDPQVQASTWIKNTGKQNGLVCSKLGSANLLKILENAVKFGNQVLIEGVEENLDAALDPILLRQVYKKGPGLFINFNDSEIAYNLDFTIYFVSKRQNPHFLPETGIKTNIINFAVTQSGLEEQLLIEVVMAERPELEEQKDRLVRQLADDKKQLVEIQDRILKLISDATGNLLDDEQLILTLDASKMTSDTITLRMSESELTNEQIQEARNIYRQIAERASVIYFVVADLPNVNPMYEFSLEYFRLFFVKKINELNEFTDNIKVRIQYLRNNFSLLIFYDISRGLFETHKLLFAFLMAVRIQISEHMIQQKQFNFFLSGRIEDFKAEHKPDIIKSDSIWKEICALQYVSINYQDISKSNQQILNEIQTLIDQENFTLSSVDFVNQSGLTTPFEKVLLLKILKPNKINQIMFEFVQNVLGESYLDLSGLDLKGAFLNSGPQTPLIFLLSPGADPIGQLYGLAKERDLDPERIKMISLGQGQNERAKGLIKLSSVTGDWVCLQNCHLSLSFLPELETLFESSEEISPDFRLFLTTMPTPKFPPSVLQQSVKVTLEPTKGLKSNLKKVFREMDDNYIEEVGRQEFLPLLYCLSIFHAAISERKKFGAIGWNIQYQWMTSDLETCQKQLKFELMGKQNISFEALKYMICNIHYGGRITDSKDEILMSAMLEMFFGPQSLIPNKLFDENQPEYFVPSVQNISEMLETINKIPINDSPEILGLNINANINLDLSNSKETLNLLLEIDPSNRPGSSSSINDEGLNKLIDKMIQKQPGEILTNKQIDFKNSFLVLRNQESDRFNQLLDKIKNSLNDLKEAINGTIVMSLELEEMQEAISLKRIPANWRALGFLSIKSLNGWFDELCKRIEFFKVWMLHEKLDSYWLSAFYFPQGFITAVLQSHARKINKPIDTLVLNSSCTQIFCLKEENPMNIANMEKIGQKKSENEINKNNNLGITNIHGLYIQNAHFNIINGTIEESDPKILSERMPIVKLIPREGKQNINDKVYECPMYKTSLRQGDLSTTGHSTNFVMDLDLNYEIKTKNHWVRRGVALLLHNNEQ